MTASAVGQSREGERRDHVQTQGGRLLPVSGISATRSGCAPEDKTLGSGRLLTQLAGIGREVWSGEGRAREDPCPAHLEAAKSDSPGWGTGSEFPHLTQLGLAPRLFHQQGQLLATEKTQSVH